ncbi:MAG: PspC domain-containing protein [Actinomycetota bacterium]
MDSPSSTDPSAGPPPPPTPPPFGTPRPRQLRRRPDEGPIAGVCAGVAAYFNVDPVIVRIATVVLALSGPGVVAYVLAWIFVPAESEGSPPTPSSHDGERHDRGAQIFGIVLLAVAVSVLWGDWWSPARKWLLPLGLIALGTWLLLRRGGDDVSDAGPISGPIAAGPPTSAPPVAPWMAATNPAGAASGITPADLDTDRAGDATLVSPEGQSEATLPPPPWEPGPGASPVGDAGHRNGAARRRRGMLAPIIMGALLVWSGIAWLADVSLESGLAVALCILGIGFVLGAFVGGSWALVVPAFGIGAALVIASVADIPLSGPVGERTWAPQRVSEVRERYELSVGEGTLDLRGLELGEGDRLDIAAAVGIGHLVVLVPEGVSYFADYRVAAGEVDFGAKDSGVGVETRSGFEQEDDVGRIELDLQVGLGQIELRSRLPVDRPDAPR